MHRKSSLSHLLLASVVSLFIAASATALHAARACNPRDFGAKADGTTKDTAAIQKAIDTCAAKGGGTVRLDAGNYLSAPIVLKSNITLQLDKGATLLGSPDHADYPAKVEFRLPALQSLVSATNAENVSITGEGTIDGQGESWWSMMRGLHDAGVMGNPHPRPRLVVFDHCKHVRVEGVTIQNSPFWQLVPYYSDDVLIRNVRILAPYPSPNTDAVDPFSSSNVRIDHLYADTGDDDIAIKSGAINSPGGDDPARDITITDCTFRHGHGLSIGSEISGGARNIVAERIHFDGTDNGIRVKANRDRGNDVSNLVFSDIDMKDVKNPLVVSEYYPRILPEGDVVFKNVTATGALMAGAIVGLPEAPVTDIVLTNVNLSGEKGLSIGYATVTGQGVKVEAAQGDAIIKMAGATVTLK
jgi:polygalacturonase